MITPYDSREALPAWDLFDNDMIRLSIMTAKDKYDEAKKDLKEFLDKYGNFYSPLQRDMDWYKENVTDKFLNTIDDLYARGIDPLRSPEGRAAVRQAMNSVDVGTINAMKQNAITAQEYLKNKAQLEASGKYDPNLEENYLGYNISDWSTVKNGMWDRLSPTEAMSLKQLTESSFNNRTPHDLTQKDVESFGMKYDPNARYKGFTYNDLLDIANTAAPGLTGTVYADYFRDIAKQKLIQNGIKNPTLQQVNMLLAYDIADQQHEYMIRPEADYTDHYKQESLKLQKIRNGIMAMRARAAGTRSSNGGSGGGNIKPQFDYNDFLIGTTAANILGKTSWGARIGVGGVSDYNPEKVSGFMGAAQKELAEGVYNYKFQTPTKSPLGLGKNFNMTDYLWNKQRNNMLEKSGGLIDIGSRYGKTFNMGAVDMSAADLDIANKSFLSQISVPSSPEHFAQWTQRQSDTDNSDYVLMNLGADKGRIYSSDEVALTSAGVDRPKDVPAAMEKTKQLRKNLEQRFIDGKTMMKSEGFVLGRVGNDGAHHVFQKIRIVNKNKYKNANNGDLQEFNYNNLYKEGEVIYYDMGADTQGNPNYSNDFMENMNPVVTDQSLGSDRSVLKSLGLSNTNVKSDNSVPYLDYSSDNYDDDLLDLMGY